MLNQEICKKCIEENWGEHSWWDKDPDCKDSMNWKKGYIVCPIMHEGKITSTLIEEVPPKWCVYRFEQSIAVGMELEDVESRNL